jgi:short-subunit dehydrogenase
MRKVGLMDFEGSWALVTGASSGIGEMFARELVGRDATQRGSRRRCS